MEEIRGLKLLVYKSNNFTFLLLICLYRNNPKDKQMEALKDIVLSGNNYNPNLLSKTIHSYTSNKFLRFGPKGILELTLIINDSDNNAFSKLLEKLQNL